MSDPIAHLRSGAASGTDQLEAELAELLAAHAGVNSTAGWDGSPDPRDPRNIRRVCKCGAVIDWHDRSHERPGVSYPMSGYPFDEMHRAHIAAVLAEWSRQTATAHK